MKKRTAKAKPSDASTSTRIRELSTAETTHVRGGATMVEYALM
jgi:hypothetical protein